MTLNAFLNLKIDKNNLVKKDIYGGIYSISIPDNFMDLRQFCNVPNHQEVFMDPVNDLSIIIDINEKASIANENISKFYSEQNVIDNEASNHNIIETETVPIELLSSSIIKKYPTIYSSYSISTMDVQKKACVNINTIKVYILVIRV